MLAVIRREIIGQKLLDNKFLTVKELSEEFHVTDETIRRDLKLLEEKGELFRTHGGAYLKSVKDYDIDVNYRQTKELEAKQKIAVIAKDLVQDNNVVFLDSSTTAAEIAKAICNMNLTVVTNSLISANILVNYSTIKIIVIGGELDPTNLCFISDSSSNEINRYFTQKCFVSCRSLCLEHGPMDSNERLAQIRLAAIQNSNSVYLIADHTKFSEVSLYKIASFKELDAIITDVKPDARWHQCVEENEIDLLYPE